VASEKLADALEESVHASLREEFQSTLDEDAEFIDNIIDKLSELKVVKEEVEKRCRLTNPRQSLRIEESLQ